MIRIEKGLHHPGQAFRARIAEATDQPAEFFESDDDEESEPVTLDDFLRLRISQMLREIGAGGVRA
jgi:transcriptional regulator with XRE-family HTH domain